MEIEKSLGGVASSDRVDGGTGSAMFGQLLTWMQESDSSKYIVATSNDVQPLLAISQGALMRRFDDIFFVDLPSRAERTEILKIQNKKYGSNVPEKLMADLENYTGAEIEKICKSSIYEGVDKAVALTKTIYEQNKSLINNMRSWAKKNARYASASRHEGTKKVTKKAVSTGRRRLKR